MQVIFYFSSGIEENLARQLESRGVTVEGARITDCSWQSLSDDDDLDSDEDDDDAYPITSSTSDSRTIDRLNLDVSSMVAYVSALTNGRNHFNYQQHLLMQQAEWERARPVKPILDQLFHGLLLRISALIMFQIYHGKCVFRQATLLLHVCQKRFHENHQHHGRAWRKG